MNRNWFALMVAILAVAVRPGVAAHPDAQKPLPGEDIFKGGVIPRIRIELSRGAYEQLRQHPRAYVTATVREGNMTYTNVSIRLKGGPGSSRPLDDRKPAFTVNFERLAQGQKFHGLKKMHLNNSVQDSTYLSEEISRELFEAAGVPAPRAGHAVVELNGHEPGLYVLVEGANKQFLRRYFKDAQGNVYDGHSGNDVNRSMRTNSGDNPSDQSRLRALASAVTQRDLDVRLARLNETLDLERFISFIAVEVLICHWDGYALGRNNYRIYHDRERNRMVFLPQGADQTFRRQNIDAFPQMNGLVARSVMEIPQMRERYRERMSQLLTNVFQIGPITNRLFKVASGVRLALAETDPQAAANYIPRVAGFCRLIRQRVNRFEHQFLSPATTTRFSNEEIIALPNWEPKALVGSPNLSKAQGPDGHTLLHIDAHETGAGSWRTSVLLDRGHYRLEGRLKLQGVKLDADDPKAGAGLRISRAKFSRAFSGDTEWTSVPFDFEVQQDQSAVELVCELRAMQGQAWFDLASLRLRRRE